MSPLSPRKPIQSSATQCESMASNETQTDGHQLREVLRSERVFYEIYPVLTWQPADILTDWFEIALHAEIEAYFPPSNPRSLQVFSMLTDLAEFLIGRIDPPPPTYGVSLSASCYTLHPPANGDFHQTKLSRSLSLVFLNVDPYRNLEEPAILTQLKKQLSLLEIPRQKLDRFTDAVGN